MRTEVLVLSTGTSNYVFVAILVEDFPIKRLLCGVSLGLVLVFYD